MSTLVAYEVSASAPAFVFGAGTEIKFFKDNQSLEQLPYPFSGNGQALEVFASGVVSSRGSVTYVIAAVQHNSTEPVVLAESSNTPGIASPFALRLLSHADSACSIVQGTVSSLLNGVSIPEKSIAPLKIAKSNWSRSSTNHAPFSLTVGVSFSESAESNGAALFEFKIVRRGS